MRSVHSLLLLQEGSQVSSHPQVSQSLFLQPSSGAWLFTLGHPGHLLSLAPIHPEAEGVMFVKAEGSPLDLEPLEDTTVGHKPSAPWNLLTTLHIPSPASRGPGQSEQGQQKL